MTKLLEQAIIALRELSDEDQDAAADALFAHLSGDHRRIGLSPDQVADVKRIRDGLLTGEERLASDGEMAALWRKCSL